MHLVLGSAPDVLLPPDTIPFDHVYCANGAIRIAVNAGLGPITLLTHAGFTRKDPNAERLHLFEQWRGLTCWRAFVDETDGSVRDMLPFFQSLGMTIPNVIGIPYDERGRIVQRVVGKNLGQGTQQTRVSTGVFAVCQALDHGAEHVVIAGIGLGNGHYGYDQKDPRHHLMGDIECLRLLAKRGRCSTTNPALSMQFGFPLIVAKGNEQRVAYQQSHATAEDSTNCLQEVFKLLGRRQYMVDFGSGAGHLVTAAHDRGVRAVGFDLYPPLPGARGSYFTWDLGQTWPGCWGDGADLVLCWETAEHVPEQGADALCWNIRQALGPGGFLVFTAATPGQGGSGHLNEQPHAYWVEKFKALGLRYAPYVTAKLRSDFASAAPTAWWYGKNLLVFEAPKGE